MLHRTKGIVIGFIKYRETSIIAKIYTEKFGIQSYIVNNIRSKRSKNKIALFQPLTILELVVYKKNNTNLNRISEYKNNTPYHSIPFNIYKATIAMFISEFCNKSIKEEGENLLLYNFLENSLRLFDNIKNNISNFHIQFLLKLTRHLGHEIETASSMMNESGNYSDTPKIRLKEKAVKKLLVNNYGEFCELNNKQRKEILEDLIKFYSFHIPNFGKLKSLEVLRELYED